MEDVVSKPAAISASKRGSSIGAQILSLAWRAADFKIGLTVFAVLILASLLGPSVLGLSAVKMDVANRFAPPVFVEGGTWKHILGTDQLGRDLLEGGGGGAVSAAGRGHGGSCDGLLRYGEGRV